MERKGHPRIEINDSLDFEMVCSDILDEWVSDFHERDGFLRPTTGDDAMNCGIDPEESPFVLTEMASDMYDRACRRLRKLGEKHFPNDIPLIRASKIIE